MRCWTSLIGLMPNLAYAALVFLGGPLHNTSLLCATVNKALGPQAGPPVVARLMVYQGSDSCSGIETDVHEKIVYLKDNGACADERIYESFYARGALAIVRATDFMPGSDHNIGNARARPQREWNAMPVLEIRQEGAAAVLASDNEMVSVVPDPNLWQPVYTSRGYQMLLRWLPSTIAFITPT